MMKDETSGHDTGKVGLRTRLFCNRTTVLWS